MTQKSLNDFRNWIFPALTTGFSFCAGVIFYDMKTDVKELKTDMIQIKIAVGVQEGLHNKSQQSASFPLKKKVLLNIPSIIAKEPEKEIELRKFFGVS